jgi:hypothetical protein
MTKTGLIRGSLEALLTSQWLSRNINPAMADPDNKELKPHYYRDNFLRLCATVEAQYADLLAPAEILFLQRFRTLDFKAQCLYVRLVSRVGPWFRESRLAYAGQTLHPAGVAAGIFPATAKQEVSGQALPVVRH